MVQQHRQGIAYHHAWQERWYFDVGSATTRVLKKENELKLPTQIRVQKARFTQPKEAVEWLRYIRDQLSEKGWRHWLPSVPIAVIAVPTDAFPSDKEILKKLYHQAGWTAVTFHTKAEAYRALLQSHHPYTHKIPFNNPEIVMDIGAETTELVLIGQGQIVRAMTWYQGGNALTQAIRRVVHTKHLAEIDWDTAEKCKASMTGLWSHPNAGRLQHRQSSFEGKSLSTGEKVEVTMTALELHKAYEAWFEELVDKLRQLTLPHAHDVVTSSNARTIWITGGGSQLPGLSSSLETEMGVSVAPLPQATSGVVNGLVCI